MVWNPISEEEFSQIAAGIEQAEQSGIFDQLFTGNCQEMRQLPTKEALLSCIDPEMRLYKSFFMKIYGYEISFPGFAETALSRLEAAGCSRARGYYISVKAEYEFSCEKDLKETAQWYAGHQKEGDRQWSQNGKTQRLQLLKLKSQLLTKKLRLLKKNSE